MKIKPMSMSKIDAKDIDKLSCIIRPSEILSEPEGNVLFGTKDTLLSACPLLSETRNVEFLTPSTGAVWVKNTYPFDVEISDVKVNQDIDTINSFTVDMYAKITERICADTCFVFMLTNNHLLLLEELALKSLYTYGNYPDIPIVIAGFNLTPKIKNRLSRYNCKVIDFFEHEKSYTVEHKMSLWTLSQAIHSNYFVFMDCDLVFGTDINGLIDVIHQYPDDRLFCHLWDTTLRKYYTWITKNTEYVNKVQQAHRISDKIYDSHGYINTGLYIMPRLCALNINSLSQTHREAINQTREFYYTEEQVLNICAKRLDNIVELPFGYNYPLTAPDDLVITNDGITHNGKHISIAHLIAGPKINHIRKVRQKVNWKINTEHLYQESSTC